MRVPLMNKMHLECNLNSNIMIYFADQSGLCTINFPFQKIIFHFKASMSINAVNIIALLGYKKAQVQVQVQ